MKAKLINTDEPEGVFREVATIKFEGNKNGPWSFTNCHGDKSSDDDHIYLKKCQVEQLLQLFSQETRNE